MMSGTEENESHVTVNKLFIVFHWSKNTLILGVFFYPVGFRMDEKLLHQKKCLTIFKRIITWKAFLINIIEQRYCEM